MTGQLRIGSLLALALFTAGCALNANKPPDPVQHVILAWFTDTVTENQIQQIEAETLKLQSIPQVISIETGRSIKSDRPIVDDSFDLGIVMTFRTVEDMNRYLIDPRHTEFVDRFLKGKLEKLLVYDF